MSFPNSYFSTNTAVVLFDASGRNGTVTLPHTQSTIGRVVTLKETTGAVIPGGAGSGDGTRAADSTSFSNSAPIRAISGLQLWLDAADSASLMISSTRVLQWTDKSSNAFVFDSATTNYPTLSTINGIQAVAFEGAGTSGANTQRMSNAAFSLTQGNYTVYIAAKQNTSAPSFNNGYNWLLAANNYLFIGGISGNFATFTGNGSWNDFAVNVPNYSVKNAFLGGMTVASSSLIPYYNGSNQTAKVGTTGPFTGIWLGDNVGTPGTNWNGQIGEILIFNQTLTPEDRRTVEGYLGFKWSLNSNLPASHIYRTLNPATPVGVSDISGLRLWMDPTDNTKLSLTGGSNVMSWTDKSSNAYVFSSVTTNYPFISSINGVQSVSVDGPAVSQANTKRFVNNAFTLNNSNYTIFTVGRQNPNAQGYLNYSLLLCAATDQRLQYGAYNSTFATYTGGPTWNDTNSNAPGYSVKNPFIGSMTVASSTLIPYFNGSNQNTKTGTTGTFTGLYIGDADNVRPGYNWNGQIGEIIIYNQTLSGYHRQSVEKYLANKWGLFSNLPSTSVSAVSTISIPQYINSGLSMWLDAADSSTYISSSGAVSAWNSKTTFRGITVSQATASNRPQIALGVQNGLNVMRMSNAASPTHASLSNNSVASSNVATSNSVAVFIVHNPTMNNASPFFYQINGSNRIGVHTPENTNILFDWNQSGSLTSTSRLQYSLGAGCNVYINEGFKLECYYVSGGRQGYRKNGTLLTSQASATPLFAASQVLSIGTYAQSPLSYYYRTDIGEIVWYKSALSQSQIELAEGYLAWKWGLTSALDAAHPYKSTDPFALGSQYTSTITLSTVNSDSFEDGSTRKILTNKFGHITLLAGEDRKWYQLSGTQPLQQTISSLAVSSIQGDGNYLTDIPRPVSLASTVAGLGTALYISTSALTSTVANYIANAGGITAASLVSTVGGLGRSTYVSTSQLNSTVAFITSNVSTTVLDSTELRSSITGLGSALYISSPTLNTSMASTVAGLGTAGYVSTIGPNFTFSTLNIPNDASISTLNTNVAAITDFNTSSMMASNYTLYKPSSISQSRYVMTGTVQGASGVIGGVSSLYQIQWSDDGSNWYSSLNISTGVGYIDRSQVRYLSTNLFGVVLTPYGAGSGGFYTSVDGKNWLKRGDPGYSYYTDITYNGTYLVANGNGTLKYSANMGSSWTNATNGNWSDANQFGRETNFATSWNSTTGMFVAAGAGSASNPTMIKYTTNPTTWSNVSFTSSITGLTQWCYDIALGGLTNSRWVAVGPFGGFYSDDAANWSPCVGLTAGYIADYLPATWTIAYSQTLNRWVAGGYQRLHTSADGITYSANLWSNAIGMDILTKAEWLNGKYYATGRLLSGCNISTSIIASTDGSNWTGSAVTGGISVLPTLSYQNYQTASISYGNLQTQETYPTVFSSDGSRLLRNNVDYMGAYTKDIYLQSTLVASNFISTPQLTSSVSGISTTLDTYVSVAEMTSTVTGLGNTYISTFPPTSLLSSITVGENIYSSSFNTRYIQGSTMTTSSVTGNNVNFNISSVLESGAGSTDSIIQTGLTAYFDPGNASSYSGSGSNMTSLVGSVSGRLVGSYSYSASNGGNIRLNNTSGSYAINTAALKLINSVTFRTISMWVYIHSASADFMAVVDGRTGDAGSFIGNDGVGSFWSSGSLYKNGGSATSITWANIVATQGVWQHLTFVATSSAADDLLFFAVDGGVSSPVSGLNASFGPIQVYSSALTQAENTSNYNVFSSRFQLGLLLYLDGSNYSGSGSTWSNLAVTGSSYNATLFNTPTYSSSNGGYFSFLDTSAQYATAPNLGNQSRWTVEAWTRTTGTITATKGFMIVGNAYNPSILKQNFLLGTLGSSGILAASYDGGWQQTSPVFSPSLNTWYHFVATYNGSAIQLYVNGVLSASVNYSGTPVSGGEVRIARRWDGDTSVDNMYKGDIGVVRIYNRALNSNEIISNYNTSASRFGLPPSGTSYVSSVSLTTDGSLLYTNGSNIARNYIQTANIPSTLSGYGFVSSSQLTSTVAGLNTYVSSFIDPSELASTVANIGLSEYISSLGLTTTFTSSVAGLGTATYISTPSLNSTLEGLSTNLTSVNGQFISSIIDNYYNHSTFTVQSTATFSETSHVNNIYYEGSTFVTTDVLRSTMDAYFNQPTIYVPQDYSF